MAKTIIIDAGHGGTDPGAVGNGYKEKDITLGVSKYLNEFLTKDSNYTPFMTRNTDTYMSVDARWQFGNSKNPDLFFSIHVNSAVSTTARGFEIYPQCPKETYHDKSYNFALKVCENMKDIQTLRGIDGCRYAFLVGNSISIVESNNTNPNGYKTYYGVVRNSKCPAVLSEMGFISTTSDVAKFGPDTKQKLVAARYYISICNYFGTTPLYDKNGNLSSVSTNTIYKVQVGAFLNKTNAQNYIMEVKSKGFEAFIVEPTTDKLYRVQVGAFSSKSNAENFLKDVKSNGFISSYIITV